MDISTAFGSSKRNYGCGDIRGMLKIRDGAENKIGVLMFPEIAPWECKILSCDRACRTGTTYWEDRELAREDTVENSVNTRAIILIKGFGKCTGTLKISIETLEFKEEQIK